MRRGLVALLAAGALVLAMATPVLADQTGYEGQPGNQSNGGGNNGNNGTNDGQKGYEGQPGNQGG